MDFSRRVLLNLLLSPLAGCDRARPSGQAATPGVEASGAGLALPAASLPPAPTASPLAPVLPLLRHYPAIASRVAVRALGSWPTPVEHAERLGARLGIRALFTKRDDRSGELYGGGKVRKLEWFLGEAMARGHRAVLTVGGVGSNQAVATALYGKSMGLNITLVLAPQQPGEHVRRNLLASCAAGATLRFALRGVAEATAKAQEAERHGGPYVIPPGGSSPLGNLAFVNAALELAEQIAAGVLPEPDLIYAAAGTAGSVAGLALGLALAKIRSRVVAVRASNPGTSSAARLAAMQQETAAYLRSLDPTCQAAPAEVRIVGQQLGAGYGHATASGSRAIALAREEESWELEPVYTGKALAALVADAPSLAGKTVLFWNSHSSRPLHTDGVDPQMLPPSLRPFIRAS